MEGPRTSNTMGGRLQEHALAGAGVCSQAQPAELPGRASEGKRRLCCAGTQPRTVPSSQFPSEGPQPVERGPQARRATRVPHRCEALYASFLVRLLSD